MFEQKQRIIKLKKNDHFYLQYHLNCSKFSIKHPIGKNQNFMIFQHVSKYEFKSPILKIHYFCPAFDQSVVLVAQKAIGQDFLLHINKEAEIVFKHQFGDFVDTLSMPNDKEAVVLRPEEDLIYIFGLQNQTVKKIKHFTFSKISCQNEVHFFCDSNLLCIHENGDNEQLKMTLTYYEWPLKPNFKNQKENAPAPFVEFIALQQDWNPSYLVRKMNSHSKYAWCQSRHKGYLQIRVHQIIESKSSYKIHKISMEALASSYNISHIEAAIVQMWEFRPNIFLLFTATNKNELRAVNASKVVNNTFLWDMNEQQQQSKKDIKHKKQYQSKRTKIRQTQFCFPQKYHDLQVDIIGTPSLSMFRTFYFQPGKAVPSPAYFVRNEIEKIVMQEQWTCSHLQKYIVLQRNRDTIVQGVFENNNLNKLKIRQISLMKRRELSMFLLKNMKDQPKQEWDSDLFVDIFKMFDYSEQVE